MLAPETAGMGRTLVDGSTGLALALSRSAGPTAAPLTLLVAALALGVAALGSWLVTRPR